MKPYGPWKIKERDLKYQNPWVKVYEDKVIRPDGKEGIHVFIDIKKGVSVLPLDDEIEQDDSLSRFEILYQDKTISSLQILRRIFFPSYYHLYSRLPKKFRRIVDYMELYEEDEHKAGKALRRHPETVRKYHHAWFSYLKSSDAFSVMQQEYDQQIEHLRKKFYQKKDWN